MWLADPARDTGHQTWVCFYLTPVESQSHKSMRGKKNSKHAADRHQRHREAAGGSGFTNGTTQIRRKRLSEDLPDHFLMKPCKVTNLFS